MKFVIDFVGEIEASNWKDAQSKAFEIMEQLDKFFEEFDLGLEESENEKCLNEILNMKQ